MGRFSENIDFLNIFHGLTANKLNNLAVKLSKIGQLCLTLILRRQYVNINGQFRGIYFLIAEPYPDYGKWLKNWESVRIGVNSTFVIKCLTKKVLSPWNINYFSVNQRNILIFKVFLASASPWCWLGCWKSGELAGKWELSRRLLPFL